MLQKVSCIADFRGPNYKFKKELAEIEKELGGRSFEQILADAMRKVAK